MKKISFFIFGAVLLCAFTLQAQQNSVDMLKENSRKSRELLQQRQQVQRRDQQLFRAAQNYINMNRIDAAIPVLEDLVTRNPDEKSYYDWLLRAYQLTSRIRAADSLVNEMLQREPENVSYRVDKAQVLYQSDHPEEAMGMWNEILKTNPSDLNIYAQVANAMLNVRLMDEAISVYLRAIKEIPNAGTFYLNIANIYKNRLMYAEAADFYLKYLEVQPTQQSFIFNQILAMQIEPDYLPTFFRVLEERARQENQSPEIKLLLGQLYQRYGKFDRALELYISMEDSKSDGLRLLQFAQSAERDSSYNVALKAYRYLLSHLSAPNRLLPAYNGAISTLFQLAVIHSDQQYADQAMMLIDSVSIHYPGHVELARLNYLKGLFYLNFYFDVDRAMAIFSGLVDAAKMDINLRNETLLALGDCYVMKGQLDNSLQTYNMVNRNPFNSYAAYRSARVYYFKKDWERSRNLLETLIQKQGTSGDITNDALELQMKLSFSKNSEAALARFSEAEFLLFQQKKSEAIKKFLQVTRLEKVPASLKSDAFLNAEKISLQIGEPLKAADYSAQAVQDEQLHEYADQHLFLLAGIMQNSLNKPAEAFKIYMELVQDYPHSLLADQARDQMKILREQKGVEFP
jgi:tetratricopeptide (TPR) repeat protein